jgi:hypothetical protein
MGIRETPNMVTSSPANIRIENRQKKNKKEVWGKARWKRESRAFKEGKICEWCGATEILVVCHPPDIFPGHPDYWDLTKCHVLCQKCNLCEMAGLVICKECREGYHTPLYEKCLNCDEERAKKIKDWKEKKQELTRKIQDEQNALRRRIYKERKEQ